MSSILSCRQNPIELSAVSPFPLSSQDPRCEYLWSRRRHGLVMSRLAGSEQEQLLRAFSRWLCVCDLLVGWKENLPGPLSFPPFSPSLRWSLLWIRLSCSRRASEQAVSRSPIRQKTLSSITTVGTSDPSSWTMTPLKWVLPLQPLSYTHLPVALTPVASVLVSPLAGPFWVRARGMLLALWHICFPEPSVPGVCTTSVPLLHTSSEGAPGFPF